MDIGAPLSRCTQARPVGVARAMSSVQAARRLEVRTRRTPRMVSGVLSSRREMRWTRMGPSKHWRRTWV